MTYILIPKGLRVVQFDSQFCTGPASYFLESTLSMSQFNIVCVFHIIAKLSNMHLSVLSPTPSADVFKDNDVSFQTLVLFMRVNVSIIISYFIVNSLKISSKVEWGHYYTVIFLNCFQAPLWKFISAAPNFLFPYMTLVRNIFSQWPSIFCFCMKNDGGNAAIE